MKVTLVVHHFPPRYTAGAELYTYRLAQWLLMHGHAVDIVTVEAIDGRKPLEVVEEELDGIPVSRLTLDLFGDDPSLTYDNPHLANWFGEHLSQVRPDLVHFQAGYLIGVAPLRKCVEAGVPAVLTLHDYWYLCPRLTLQRGDGQLCAEIPENPAGCAWCRLLEKRRFRLPDQVSRGALGRFAQTVALREGKGQIDRRRQRVIPALTLPDAVIAPSAFLARRFEPYVPGERLHILRYGLDLSPFEGLPRKEQRSHDDLRIGYIGQIAPHKGIHLLVEAFRKLTSNGRHVALHIHGALESMPDYVRHLRGLVGHTPGVFFHGRFENSNVAEILYALDTVVVPSTWYENSPLAILEAHAAGRPVVTSKLGGMAEMVEDGVNGLHFIRNDVHDLRRQLQRLVDDPELVEQLKHGVRTPASIDQEMQQLLQIYHSVLPDTDTLPRSYSQTALDRS